jgi:hypothetical protein
MLPRQVVMFCMRVQATHGAAHSAASLAGGASFCWCAVAAVAAGAAPVPGGGGLPRRGREALELVPQSVCVAVYLRPPSKHAPEREQRRRITIKQCPYMQFDALFGRQVIHPRTGIFCHRDPALGVAVRVLFWRHRNAEKVMRSAEHGSLDNPHELFHIHEVSFLSIGSVVAPENRLFLGAFETADDLLPRIAVVAFQQLRYHAVQLVRVLMQPRACSHARPAAALKYDTAANARVFSLFKTENIFARELPK